MTKVINLYGGPGTGKSTYAAYLFSLLKEKGINAELVSEYVKQWAWESRTPVNYDQFYFFGKQARKEYSLFPQVDLIVTDSPVAICGYYCRIYGTAEQRKCFDVMVQTYYKMVADQGHEYEHVFLNRVKPYNPKGRFQDEAEARDIDQDMKVYLRESGFKYRLVDGHRDSMKLIADRFEVVK